jgi:hypothetical protein
MVPFGFLAHTSSMIRHVLAGRSGSLTTESDSMSSRPACRASPVGADEKSSLNWIFSRLSLSRFMSTQRSLTEDCEPDHTTTAQVTSKMEVGPRCITSVALDAASQLIHVLR